EADRGVVGLGDADATSRQVDNVSLHNCHPPITVVQELLDAAGKRVLVVHVPPRGSQRPYRTNRARYHVRTSSGCRDASQAELLRLFQAVDTLYYDETPLTRLQQFVKHRCPVIPVLLAGCEGPPELPVFLSAFQVVDFRRTEPDPLAQLVWGVTGTKP